MLAKTYRSKFRTAASGKWDSSLTRKSIAAPATPVFFWPAGRPDTATIRPVLEQPIIGRKLPAAHQPLIAIYPGSFDPLTNGHLDLIERGSRLADQLIVAILRNDQKKAFFGVEERIEMMRLAVATLSNVAVDSFDGLLVDYAKERNARLILRGIRAISDYEYELQMALMNRRLRPETETVFLMAAEAYSFLSSKLVKEVISLGGDIAGLVPAFVEERLKQRMAFIR